MVQKQIRTLGAVLTVSVLLLVGCESVGQSTAKCERIDGPLADFTLATSPVVGSSPAYWLVSPERISAYDRLGAAMAEVLPNDFDPFNDSTPEIDRLIAGTRLAAGVLSQEDSYSDRALVDDWYGRLKERIGRLIEVCGLQ